MTKTQSPSKWSRGTTLVLTTLMGWIPLPPGIVLRNLLYRKIFRRLGKSVRIQHQVEFTDGSCIDIGDGVTISRGVY
ncbi:MAG: acyltransferase, partial [Moorea sp. SIO2B7]|nr:acyltransferase [Moorena sp. SIO2B7]